MSLPVIFCTLLAFACTALGSPSDKIVVEKVEREVRYCEILLAIFLTLHLQQCDQAGANPCCVLLQINAAKFIVLERQTLTYKNTGSSPVPKILLCYPSDQTPDRAFFEVRHDIIRHCSNSV